MSPPEPGLRQALLHPVTFFFEFLSVYLVILSERILQRNKCFCLLECELNSMLFLFIFSTYEKIASFMY